MRPGTPPGKGVPAVGQFPPVTSKSPGVPE